MPEDGLSGGGGGCHRFTIQFYRGGRKNVASSDRGGGIEFCAKSIPIYVCDHLPSVNNGSPLKERMLHNTLTK